MGSRDRYVGVRCLLLLAFVVLGVFMGAGIAAADEPENATATGRLLDAGEPVVGATVRVLDSDGEEVATTDSDEKGSWKVDVPIGTLTFEVDPDSLPEGVSVQSNVTRDVAAGRANIVVFTFGEVRTSYSTPLYEKVIRLSIDGLRFGLVIAVAAIGLSLIFGTTGLTNFAHGELVTLGAVFAWIFNVTMGMPLFIASLMAVVAGVALGWLNNAALWRAASQETRGTHSATRGVHRTRRQSSLPDPGLVLRSPTGLRRLPPSDAQRTWGPIAITDMNLLTIVVSLIVLVAVALMLQKTSIGKAMRAVSDNRDLAAASGINVERVITFVWCLGGALAGLGGVLFAFSELGGRVQWEMGFKLLLLMFAGITLGGLGTAYGALLGCIIVGLLVQLSTLVIDPDLKYVGGLLVLIVILVVRPQGILGSRERIG